MKYRQLFCKTALLCGVAALLAGPWTGAQAAALRFCDQPADLSAAEKDRIFRFSAIVKAQLDQSGHRLALISRSGLDLQRFGVRYSHSGISLRDSANTRWSVRQLYFACDEKKPRVFDQGMSGFLLGLENPSVGYISLVLLPNEAESELAAHIVTTSPDVTVSTNLGPWVNRRGLFGRCTHVMQLGYQA